MRVELDRIFEVLYRRVAVFFGKCSKDKPAKVISAAKVFFPSGGAVGRAAGELFLLVIRKLEPQPLEDALGDAVLNGEYVLPLGIDTVAPENVAGRDIQ